MPTPKRWHPVSRDLNDDPEVWELTDIFGDRALRIHLELLATLDRTDNRWRLAGHWLAGLSRKVRQQPATVQRVIGWMLEKGWLISEESAADGSPTMLSARNYWKYHRMREPIGAKVGTNNEHERSPHRVPSYPNLPYPNQREEIREIREIREVVDTVNCGDKENRTVSTVGNASKPNDRMDHIGDILKGLPTTLPQTSSEHLKDGPAMMKRRVLSRGIKEA